jgi:5-hydroxyisourate hydrolase
MSAITTHVLDTARGRPAAGVPVQLEQRDGLGDQWTLVGRGETDADGRLRTLMPSDARLGIGQYRLTFDTRTYFAGQSVPTLYPIVVIVFETTPGEAHYHVPLLLGPFGYTTYRGS